MDFDGRTYNDTPSLVIATTAHSLLNDDDLPVLFAGTRVPLTCAAEKISNYAIAAVTYLNPSKSGPLLPRTASSQ